MAIISAWPARTANELNQKSICRRDKSREKEGSWEVGGGCASNGIYGIKCSKKRERNLCNFPYERELLIASWQAEFVISSTLSLLLS